MMAFHVEEIIQLVEDWFVNRTDRYGGYRWAHDRMRPETLPSSGRLERCEKEGKRPPYFGEWQIANHLILDKTYGVHAISRRNTCKWVCIDLDRHGESVRAEDVITVRDVIVQATLSNFDLKPVMEDSGGGGWHIWILFSDPIPSPDAYRFVKHLGEVGRRACRDMVSPPGIDLFPKNARHDASFGKCAGGWVRLPGRHHTRDHVSDVVTIYGEELEEEHMWYEFRRAGQANTPELVQAALARIPSEGVEPERAPRTPRKPATKRPEKSRATATRPVCSEDYSTWTLEELMSTPLKAGTRWEREREIVTRTLKEGGLPSDAERNIRRLYDEASGDSRDLANPDQNRRLHEEIPNMVARIGGKRQLKWWSAEQVQSALNTLMDRAREYGWNPKHFRAWLVGLATYLQQRAVQVGVSYMASTILPADHNGGEIPYALRDLGGDRRRIPIPDALKEAVREHVPLDLRAALDLRKPTKTAYIAYLYLQRFSLLPVNRP